MSRFGPAPTYHDSKRVAKDPADYLRRIRAAYADDPRGYSFDIVSIDGTTKSGLTRYTLRIGVADPGYYDRLTAARRAAGG